MHQISVRLKKTTHQLNTDHNVGKSEEVSDTVCSETRGRDSASAVQRSPSFCPDNATKERFEQQMQLNEKI